MAIDIAELGLSVRSDGVIVATSRLGELERSAKKAETSAKRLQRKMEMTSKQLGKFGRNFSLYVTAPILGAGVAAVKIGASFEATLTKINTLVGLSHEEVMGFRKEILAMGPAVGHGPVELADALFAVTSAGQRGAQALDTLEKAAKASAIGLGDTRTIALAATAAVQAYGTANMNSTKSLEILIGTIEQGNVEAESIAPVLGRVIGMAANLGVAFEDVGAFIAVFTRLGVDASESTTALRGVLSSVLRPAQDAKDAFAAMGLSVEEIRRQIKEEGFIVTFQELVNRSKQFGVDLVSILPNVRALSGVLG
ncbi:MAG: phage tail tape measure protein, partial [Lysobacterales bacterium]